MSIIFVIGPSCAGKSTYIKENLPDYKIIDLFDFQDYKFITVENIMKSYYDCKDALIEAIKENENVVLEHTLLKAERRKIYIDAIKELGNFDIDIVVIKPDINTLMKQKALRGTNIYQAQDELDLLEIPTKEEGFRNITIIENTRLSEQTTQKTNIQYTNNSEER